MSRLNAYTLPDLKACVPKMRNDLSSMEKLRPIYNYSFEFSRDRSTSHKLMKYEVAEVLWGQLLYLVYPYAKDWAEFLRINSKPKKSITKDTWNLLFQFVEKTIGDVKEVNNVIEESVWPTLIEDFAKYLKERLKL